MALSSGYGQDNVYYIIQYSPIRNKARHREALSCPKNNALNHGVELCASIVSHNNVADRPSSHHTQNNTPERGTGHKIVTSGALLANTSATILAKILMVGNADTSTVDE